MKLKTFTLTICITVFLFASSSYSQQQENSLYGKITGPDGAVPFANLLLQPGDHGAASDENGNYSFESLADGAYRLQVSALGYHTITREVTLKAGERRQLNLQLSANSQELEETVVTGTLKPVSRLESPVPVEVYSPAFLKKNPTANVFESLQLVNGVRPQINCNVCNTGDIHINGLEGPYTLVLIDGMPIVSGLGTVYGLSGIPNSLIEQIEVIKGPASTLYGSEAVGGLINVITKNAMTAPEVFADGFATGWGEYNVDLGAKFGLGKKVQGLLGMNYFLYNNPIDNNGDNFTDLTLQDRVSIFQKLQWLRDEGRLFTLAGRFFYEDRWGGEMQWTPEFRGGDEIYGESIYTRRWELIGKYELPLEEKFLLSFSYNDHYQNSVYGDTPYIADQRIGFTQLTWDKELGAHDLLIGTALRYNYYDDDTPATADNNGNAPDEAFIPGIFAQDEIQIAEDHNLLLGARLDYDQRHGSIFTPRGAYRWKITDNDIFRLNAGTGFRVVNLFTEDHAALTGAREVVIAEALDPERSFNVNINYMKKVYADNGTFINLDASLFYTRFSNAILPDYETDPNSIIYDNLDGYSISRGASANLDMVFPAGLKILLGATLQDVSSTENGVTTRQVLTERFTGTWSISYEFRDPRITLDYTGNVYGPMRLPLLGELDPRKPNSPTWSIQNIQATYKATDNIELYGGVKNLLNWTPNRGNPFIIARANDPFDREVTFDSQGQVVATDTNPYALTFDPSYVYAPNQGIRGFLGLRYRLD